MERAEWKKSKRKGNDEEKVKGDEKKRRGEKERRGERKEEGTEKGRKGLLFSCAVLYLIVRASH